MRTAAAQPVRKHLRAGAEALHKLLWVTGSQRCKRERFGAWGARTRATAAALQRMLGPDKDVLLEHGNAGFD